MPLNGSGPISIGGSTAGQSINLEFGRAAGATTSMSQLYRGGGIVGAGAPNVPTSGTISLSQFYGAANLFNYVISTNQTNLNLRGGAIAAGWDGAAPLIVTINSGVYISSNSTGTPALTVSGSFPGGVSLTNNGFVVGIGGAGGAGQDGLASSNPNGSGGAGASGGLALSVSSPISIANAGTIAGGGGGGGGGGGLHSNIQSTSRKGGGGGGGGRSGATASLGGAGGTATGGNGGTGTNGTNASAGGGGAGAVLTAGASYAGDGGSGGGWGASGSSGGSAFVSSSPSTPGGGAGSAGAAVSGNSNITWVATGTRLGAIE